MTANVALPWWQDLTPHQITRLAAADGVAVLPLAAIEQHGEHLPLSTDLDIALGLLEAALPKLRPNLPVCILPPLAVGMGIYLPMALTLLIPLGALAGHFYNRWAERQSDPAFAERMGVLAATGLIVGESLFGVAFAGIAAVTGSPEALAVLERNPVAEIAGLLIFSGTVTGLYRWTRRAVSRS